MARSLFGATPFFVMSGDQSWGQRKPKTKQLPPSDLLSYPAILTFEGPWGKHFRKWSKLNEMVNAAACILINVFFALPASFFMGFDVAGSAVLEPSPQSRMICSAKWVPNKHQINLLSHEFGCNARSVTNKTKNNRYTRYDGLCTYCMIKMIQNSKEAHVNSLQFFPVLLCGICILTSWWFYPLAVQNHYCQ